MVLKNLLTICIFLATVVNLNAQFIMNDPSIVAQERRQVFAGWGNWKPDPKYFLGVQTNFAYSMVWGNWAPSRNKAYKRGNDIRPLSPTGLQWQRYSQISLMEAETKKIEIATNEWKEEENNEFLHQTNTIAVADPLYLVYYKPNLKTLVNFPVDSPFYIDWGFSKPKAFKNAVDFGMIAHYREMILELQDKYEVAQNVNVARGKRLLMYHDVFIEWRKMKERIKALEHTFYLQDLAKSDLMKWNQSILPTYGKSDAQIFQDVLNQSNIK